MSIWKLSVSMSVIVLCHFAEALVPVWHRDRDAVRLGRRRDPAAPLLARQLEGVAHDAVDAGSRHDGFLHHELAIGAGKHPPAHRGILALGVLAHDDVVDVAALAARERRGHARHQPDRADIRVLVEFPPHGDQGTPQRDMVGDLVRPADGAEEHRVVAADAVLPVLGHHPAVRCIVVVRGEIELVGLDPEAVPPGRRFEDPQSLGHDLLADAVPRDHGETVHPVGPGSIVGHARLPWNGVKMIARDRECHFYPDHSGASDVLLVPALAVAAPSRSLGRLQVGTAGRRPASHARTPCKGLP